MFVFVVVEKIDGLKRRNVANKSIYWTMVTYDGPGKVNERAWRRKGKRKRKRPSKKSM